MSTSQGRIKSAQEAISVLKHEHPAQHWGEPERPQLPPLVLLDAPSVGLGLTSKTRGGGQKGGYCLFFFSGVNTAHH